MVLSVLFLFLALNGLVGHIRGNALLHRPELGLMIADLVLSVMMISGSVLVIRRGSMGYVCGGGILFTYVMLFVGLIVIMLVQPGLLGVEMDVEGMAVIGGMAIVVVVPFALFILGICKKNQI